MNYYKIGLQVGADSPTVLQETQRLDAKEKSLQRQDLIKTIAISTISTVVAGVLVAHLTRKK